MGTSLTREKLLETARLKRERIEVEGFGTVTLKRQSAMQRSRRLAQTYDDNGNRIPLQIFNENLYAIVDQVCNEDGSPMFSEKDLPEIGELDPIVLDPLVEAIQTLNGIQLEGKE